jgi:hypothetical protein
VLFIVIGVLLECGRRNSCRSAASGLNTRPIGLTCRLCYPVCGESADLAKVRPSVKGAHHPVMKTVAGLAFIATLSQLTQPTGAAAVMESLLFGFDMAPAALTAGLPADAARSLATYRQRERAFKPTIARPAKLDGPEGNLYFKRVGIERALFCLLDRPDSLEAAEDFATGIKLFYEWEGFANGPLTEADSADDYVAQHPASAAVPYVQLFAGHRKLCAASGMEDLDPASDRAQGIARDADRQLAAARDAGHPLVRIVADYLLTSRKCFER